MTISWTPVCALAAMVLLGCQCTPEPAMPGASTRLEDKEWTLVAMNGKAYMPMPNQSAPILELEAASMEASGSSGLNLFAAGYVLDGSMLKFDRMVGTTLGGSSPEVAASEVEFLKALRSVTNWRFSGAALEVRDGEKTVLRFVPKP